MSAGITLALFGGVRKHSMDQNKVPVRGDIHVIIVGMLSVSFLNFRLNQTSKPDFLTEEVELFVF